MSNQNQDPLELAFDDAEKALNKVWDALPIAIVDKLSLRYRVAVMRSDLEGIKNDIQFKKDVDKSREV